MIVVDDSGATPIPVMTRREHRPGCNAHLLNKDQSHYEKNDKTF